MDKQMIEEVEITQKAIRKNADSEGAFVELLNQEMKELRESQSQIEEMAKIMEKTFSYAKKHYDDKYEPFELEVYPDEIASELYNSGCRKIPEGAVVVSKQVWEEHIENWDKTTKAVEERARKETAEKYHTKVSEAIDSVPNATKEFVEAWKAKNDEIAKEITEG